MKKQDITNNVKAILESLPDHVELEAAAKTRSANDVRAAIQGGVQIIGYNYVQEAERIKAEVTDDVKWHMIGHLQKNKVKKAVPLFDMIETIDSVKLAKEVNKRCAAIDKIMPVLIEINSGREEQKAGIFPEETENLVRAINTHSHIHVQGLMTMGPFLDDPEELRPFFRETKELFDKLAAEKIEHVDMHILSMGMSDSYKIAIEEGANLVRLGTVLFGPRS